MCAQIQKEADNLRDQLAQASGGIAADVGDTGDPLLDANMPKAGDECQDAKAKLALVIAQLRVKNIMLQNRVKQLEDDLATATRDGGPALQKALADDKTRSQQNLELMFRLQAALQATYNMKDIIVEIGLVKAEKVALKTPSDNDNEGEFFQRLTTVAGFEKPNVESALQKLRVLQSTIPDKGIYSDDPSNPILFNDYGGSNKRQRLGSTSHDTSTRQAGNIDVAPHNVSYYY
jgi:hypothetical protein